MFKAFFQETVQEKWKTAFHIRVVNISFFLEDGTMKIVEPSVDNSGLEQGSTVHFPSYNLLSSRTTLNFYIIYIITFILFLHFIMLSSRKQN